MARAYVPQRFLALRLYCPWSCVLVQQKACAQQSHHAQIQLSSSHHLKQRRSPPLFDRQQLIKATLTIHLSTQGRCVTTRKGGRFS